MAMVAGTIVMINDGMPAYLVKQVQNDNCFINVEVDVSSKQTMLGGLLKVLEKYVEIDNLRLDELASIKLDGCMRPLYVFVPVLSFELSKEAPFEFVPAAKLHSLLESVDMSSSPIFD